MTIGADAVEGEAGMASWREFEAGAPDVAERGRSLLFRTGAGEGFLTTIRGTGLPRTHPVNVGRRRPVADVRPGRVREGEGPDVGRPLRAPRLPRPGSPARVPAPRAGERDHGRGDPS